MMKKLLFSLLLMFCFISGVKAQDVTLYLFRGSTCGHCEEAINYFNNHKDEIPSNVKFVTYEVFDNKTNATLFDKVSDKVNVPKKDKNNVPFFIVGSNYEIGYGGPADFNSVINMASTVADSKEYTDIVSETIKENQINAKSMNLEQLFPEPNKVVTIIVYVIFGVIVLGFGAMIIFSRKN